MILGTNDNDILSTFFNTGDYRRGTVHHTISPSMDIQVASNFERYLYYALDESGVAVRDFMATFNRAGCASFPNNKLAGGPISAYAIDTATTLATIEQVYADTGYVLDPHTAVGVAAAREADIAGPTICIATAHPAKFPESIAPIVGAEQVHHPRLAALRELAENFSDMPATQAALRDFIESSLTA